MSAARHIHPDQLAMFLPAHHLANPERVVYGDQEGWQSHADLREEKLEESKRGDVDVAHYQAYHGKPTFHENVGQEGVKTPVLMSHHPEDPGVQWVIDGHHRIFSANEHNPNMEVPVTYE